MRKYLVTARDKGTVIYRRVVKAPSMEHALADMKAEYKCAPLSYAVESEQYPGQFDDVLPV